MIKVTRLNGTSMRLNAEFILSVESVPDTLITLRNGRTIIVREAVERIVKRFIRYKRMIHTSILHRKQSPKADSPAKSD